MKKKVVKLTEKDIESLVHKIIKEDDEETYGYKSQDPKQLKEAPIKRDIGSFEDSVDAGEGTRWNVSHPKQGRKFYDLYTEKFGPFTVFTSDDNSVKIACLERGDCWDQTDRKVSREEAAQMLGVDSLDDIGYDR